MSDDYERGYRDCRDLCAAIAELRLQEQSVLANVFPAIDEFTGEDTATQHEWFCKGRESAAANIARDIKKLKPPCPIDEASYADLRASGGIVAAPPRS
jgi:hypothetical protein